MKKILVVDDNILMRKLILNLFNNKNYGLDEAENGSEGLDKIISSHYDLVITDIVMPQMEGLEMIRHAKRINPSLKIIAMTGVDTLYLSLAKKFGVDFVFTKPLDYHTFLNTASQLLDQSEVVRQVS
jgi:YesN/AraC family two-component response regulator